MYRAVVCPCDWAGHVLRGSVRMGTVLRGRMDAAMKAKVKERAPNGWLQGAPLDNLVRDTWLALNVSHPRYMLAMPVPACLEGIHDEKFTGGTAALRWTDFYITVGVMVQSVMNSFDPRIERRLVSNS